MSSVTIGQKLDLALAATRGAGFETVEIHLTVKEIEALAATSGEQVKLGFYRGVELRPALSRRQSGVVVRTGKGPADLAPIGPRALARWLALPDPWPPADERAQRSAKVA